MKKPFLYYFNMIFIFILSNLLSTYIAKNINLKIIYIEYISKIINIFFLLFLTLLYKKFNKSNNSKNFNIFQPTNLMNNLNKADFQYFPKSFIYFKLPFYREFYFGKNKINFNIKVTLLSLLFFYLLAFIGSSLQNIFHPILKNFKFYSISGINYLKALQRIISENYFLSFFLIVFIGPILEEFSFRGFSLSILYKGKKQILVTIFMSLLFALLHFDFSRIFILLSMGFALGLIYNITESLLYPIAIHILNNCISFFALFSIKNIDAIENIFDKEFLNIEYTQNNSVILRTILSIWILAAFIILAKSIFDKIKELKESF